MQDIPPSTLEEAASAQDALTRLLLDRAVTPDEFDGLGEASGWEIVERIVSGRDFQIAVIDPLENGRGLRSDRGAWRSGNRYLTKHGDALGLSSTEAATLADAPSWPEALLALFDAQAGNAVRGRADRTDWIGPLKSIVQDPDHRVCTVEDVENFYRVLMGRPPELPPDPSRCADISDVALGFLASEEFLNAVLRPLLTGLSTPGRRFIDDPGDTLRLWTATAFPLLAASRERACSARSWRRLFEVLFDDPRLQHWLQRAGSELDAGAIATAMRGRSRPFSDRCAASEPPRPEVDLSDIAGRAAWIRRDLQDRLQLRLRNAEEPLTGSPLISLIVPVYNTPLDALARMVESVRFQTYSRWELCLADDGSTELAVRALLDTYADVDHRIKVARLPDNSGISIASNAALQLATGEYVGLLDHDDALTCDALQVMAAEAVRHDADILYSDECLLSADGVPEELFAKPDWSPLLMCNMMYVSHFTLYRAELVRSLGGFRREFDFSQDYDLALRASEVTSSIRHVEAFLYGWRKVHGSAASGGKSYARRTNLAALQSAVDRRGWGGVVRKLPTANHVFRRSRQHPHVAIIVPSDNLEHINSTLASIANATSYDNFEIRIVTRTSIAAEVTRPSGLSDDQLKLVAYDKPYNFSDKCNAGAASGAADHLIFFNDDVRVISPDWIESLLEVLTLPGVGAVGPKLLYENGTIQHAGMVTGTRRLVGTAFHSLPGDTHLHFNFAQCVREVSLLCGACLAMPAALFERLGAFNAADAPIAHSDVDLCLRVREAGLSCVYTPHAELLHFGHLSIGGAAQPGRAKKPFAKDKADIYIMQRFGEALARDPFFPRAMVETLYHDSQEPFAYHPAPRAVIRRADVLIASHDLSSSGAPKIVYDMARVLLESGRFVVVASPSDGPMRDRLVKLGAHVVIEPLLFQGTDPVRELAKNFDQVIVNTVVGWPLVAQLADVTPVWLYAHEAGLVDHYGAHFPGFVPALKSARAVWAGSARSAEALARWSVASRVIPYGVDDIEVAPPATHDGGMSVVLLGSFEPRKGQDLAVLGAIEALKRGADLTLALYGRALDRPFLEGVVQRVSGSSAIRMHGDVSYEAYQQILKAADVVLVPSRDDTLPLVSLDALSAGKALICAETVGTSAFLENGRNALVVAGPRVDTIADALEALAADPALRRRLGAGAREVFVANFTHAAFHRSLLKALGIQGAGTRATPSLLEYSS